MNIHHYTSLSSLALILKNRTIRFTRTDLLDDVQEFHLGDIWPSAVNFFVSSWSAESEESIPQWAMYGDSFKGVRLTISDNIFPWEKLSVDVHSEKKDAKNYCLRVNNVFSPFDKTNMFGNGYVLIPMYLSMHDFKNRVKYVDSIKEVINDLIIKTGSGIETRGNINEPVFIKSKHWEYQNEIRFVLMATKGPNLIYENSPEEYEDVFLSEMANSNNGLIDSNRDKAPLVKYIDLPVMSTAFGSLQVVLGPLAPVSSRVIVESLCEKYAPNSLVKESSLSGQIRGRV
ncbi:DUF2971 domain-containing protein [Pectobacterium odoriferum]|uniref:DUF2971 domain-containing protein n=1 Tax=Pectobacterium odoriferum TaxID=78398 RepID=A0ABR4VTV7_9GAMM|nr:MULTISPECIES: DUF2971 domain-containing protein [Pectobacterium]KGA42829.1 hypothetical protein KU75_02960 [Pectobacterium odoriferum]MBN3192658.1 DUF2971 domain-containing protein [Pectobacterium brasiliense]MCL6385178.1 DUF2971 domain-containing protein [Pectobacterium carotovorum subsp. carotovorum]TAJ05009.1 DUF2971 domain-containing protein [Pectobacterium versatile]